MASTPLLGGAATLAIALLAAPASGQTPAGGQPASESFAATLAGAAATAATTDQPATLVYANRSIVELRATIFSRPPSARAAAAAARLDGFVSHVPEGRVTTGAYPNAIAISIAGEPLLVIFQADLDQLTGERLDAKAADAAARLQVAFDEAVELRSPRKLGLATGTAVGLTLLYALGIWVLVRAERRVAARMSRIAEGRILRLPGGEIISHATNAPRLVRRGFLALSVVLGLVFTYAWIGAVLRRFPYTRPWGESLRAGLFSIAGSASRAVVDELPNLFTVLVIVLITRFFVRMANLAFRGVEEKRITLPGVYPETAQPTRRIVVVLIWLFALIVSYRYLPGSDSDVFKGVSVFIGLMVSLGSSGVMNQVMSGLMITYSRALRPNDFVKVGDIEGTVVHLGTLSTKIRNARNEEITIPNAIVVAQAMTNFSRHADSDGVFAPTSVTIGYNTPWRQVHALLLLAAERTAGVRPEPKPYVLQAALDDFYVRYTLLVCIEQPNRRYFTLGALHANIQDAFNEYGVQIMSPNYEADPGEPKLVPQSDWYAAPAAAQPAEAVRQT